MGCLKLEHINKGYLEKINFSPKGAVERKGNANFFRLNSSPYGFNGMEIDNEVSGNGNSYTTQFRQYDPRLGRWKSLDPLMAKYPGMSPYVAFNNNPNRFVDPDGREGQDWVKGGLKEDGTVADANTWHWEADVSSKSEADAIGANDWIPKDKSRTVSSGGKKVTLSYNALMDNGQVEWQNTEETPQAGISPFLWSQVDDISIHSRPILDRYAGMNFLGNNFTDESLNWDSKGMNRVAGWSSVVAYGSVAFATGGSMYGVFSSGGGVEMLNVSGRYAINTAKVYHNTFGKNGGYANMGIDFSLQKLSNPNGSINIYSTIGSGFIPGNNLRNIVAFEISTTMIKVQSNNIGIGLPNNNSGGNLIFNTITDSYGRSKYGNLFMGLYYKSSGAYIQGEIKKD